MLRTNELLLASSYSKLLLGRRKMRNNLQRGSKTRWGWAWVAEYLLLLGSQFNPQTHNKRKIYEYLFSARKRKELYRHSEKRLWQLVLTEWGIWEHQNPRSKGPQEKDERRDAPLVKFSHLFPTNPAVTSQGFSFGFVLILVSTACAQRPRRAVTWSIFSLQTCLEWKACWHSCQQRRKKSSEMSAVFLTGSFSAVFPSA